MLVPSQVDTFNLPTVPKLFQRIWTGEWIRLFRLYCA